MSARRFIFWLAVAVAALLPMRSHPPARAAATTTARAPESLILTPPPGGVLTVSGFVPAKSSTCPAHAAPPLRAKYHGPLRVVRDAGGKLYLINEVSFPQYLSGLAEVPAFWPPGALRAQAIAARSYATFNLRHRSGSAIARGYDICASDQCQVYRGASIELGAFGERWVAAVDATRGQVLEYGGSVIQAFFFSTSDGTTRRSFPGGTPQPWLPSVSGEDSDAPLAHWTARISIGDLAAVLAARGDTAPAALSSVRARGNDVELIGATTARVSRGEFRDALNDRAPCLFPDRYPTKGAADGSTLPQTIPSETFTLSVARGIVVVRGRGWGHGVGMSQWGARSMAARGASAPEILRHFYGPARIARISEPPHIRVLAAEGLSKVYIETPPGVTVTDERGSEIAPGDRFEVLGGRSLRVLRGRAAHIAPVLEASIGTGALRATAGATITIPFTLNHSARVSVSITGPGSLAVPARSFESGPGTIDVSLHDARGAAMAPGGYTVIVSADNGLDVVRAAPVTLTIAPVAAKIPKRVGSSWVLVVLVASLVLVLGAAAFAFARRRRQPNVNV